jgi:hypothetical protein
MSTSATGNTSETPINGYMFKKHPIGHHYYQVPKPPREPARYQAKLKELRDLERMLGKVGHGWVKKIYNFEQSLLAALPRIKYQYGGPGSLNSEPSEVKEPILDQVLAYAIALKDEIEEIQDNVNGLPYIIVSGAIKRSQDGAGPREIEEEVYKAMSVGFQPDSGFFMKDDIVYQPMTQPFDNSESENGEGKEAAGTHMRRRKQSQRRRKTSRRTRRH